MATPDEAFPLALHHQGEALLHLFAEPDDIGIELKPLRLRARRT